MKTGDFEAPVAVREKEGERAFEGAHGKDTDRGGVGRVGSRVTPHMLTAVVKKLVSLISISKTELLMKRRAAPGSIAIRCPVA